MADEPLTAGAAARRLGIAVTTLRSWHQRYGLGPSRHESGQHRRYTEGDLARLDLMRRLTADGLPAAEAARWARQAPEVPPPGRDPDGAPPVPRQRDGGRGLALGACAPAARGLARAAMRLDAPALRVQIARAVTGLGVVQAWDTVIRPVLFAVGCRTGETGELIEVEHLLSVCVSDVFGGVPRPPLDRPARILLACADEEQHTLPVEALAAALAENGVPCRVLGARVPPAALRAAVRRTGPAAVLLWSHHRSTGDPAQLAALTGGGRPALIAAGGPGWDPAELPPTVVRPASLAEALALLRAAA